MNFASLISASSLKRDDITSLLEQLLAFLQSGIPLSQALELMQRHQSKSALRVMASNIQFDLEKGLPLSKSLRERLGRNNEILSRMVELGEKSGRLETILEHLVKQRQRHAQIRKHVLQTISYPLLLMLVSFVVLWILAAVIAPEFEKIYSSSNASLPYHTVLTMKIFRFIVDEGPWFVVATATVILGFWALGKKSWRLKWHVAAALWRIPGFGAVQRAIIYYQFATCMHLIYKSGMPIGQSLEWLPNTARHLRYKAALESLAEEVMRGSKLHQAIQSSAFFSPFVERMVAIGEDTGKLDTIFCHIERHYEQKIQDYAKLATQFMEPALIIMVALLVGWTVVSMYMPIFSLGFAF